MSDLKNTPWTVVEDEKWPCGISIEDATDRVLWSETRYAYSTSQKSLAEVYDAVGFPHNDREEVSDAVKAQMARVKATVEAVNTLATKDATITRLREALEKVAVRAKQRGFLADTTLAGDVGDIARAALEETR
jgi:hypothetical protein